MMVERSFPAPTLRISYQDYRIPAIKTLPHFVAIWYSCRHIKPSRPPVAISTRLSFCTLRDSRF